MFLILVVLALSEALVPGKHYDNVFIILFENTGYSRTMEDPNFLNYANKGKSLTNYYAITHPSQPNYITLVSGDLLITDNEDRGISERSIVNLLDSKSISWKGYMEGYPGNCFTGTTSGSYARRHNPFISLDYVRNDPARCARIVNSGQLDTDLDQGTLPQYSFFTPDVRSDGHDTGISFAGSWLENFFSTRLSKFPKSTLVVITFDEDFAHEEQNRVYCVLIGPGLTPGSQDNTRHDHYSLLRTVEDNWELGNLGRKDATAVPFALPLPEIPPVNVIPGKWFDRIFVIVFENKAMSTTMADPHFSDYSQKGKLLLNFSATAHPSQPNYISMISGEVLYHDNSPAYLDETCIVDLLEQKSISWKTYQEGYHGICNLAETIDPGRYARKHNPFMSFNSITSNPTKCAKIVSETQLDIDLDSGQLPQYTFYTPNLENDGHDTLVSYAGNYLENFFANRIYKFPPKTLIVITFDEDGYDTGSKNHIYTVMIGDMITPGTEDGTYYDHYSLLRTVEDNWNLGNLGRKDATATSIPLAGPAVTPTPTPTPPTPTPTPTPPTPTPTPSPTPPTPSPTPTPPTLTPTPTPPIPPTPSPTPTPPTPTPPTPTPTPPTPTQTPTPVSPTPVPLPIPVPVQAPVPTPPKIVPGKFYDNIFVILFENTGYTITMRDAVFAEYAKKGLSLTNYYAIGHPSQPNYIALISGEFLIRDNEDHNLDDTSIVNLLDSKSISWKGYMEGYPGNCYAGKVYDDGYYARRHNPFISFNYITSNRTRCARIVNSGQLDTDLDQGTLPQYSFFTPDVRSDGHDTGISFAGSWLENFFSTRLSKFPKSTLVVITFDEDSFEENNRVYCVLIGSGLTPGSEDNERYDHYSLLRTVEENWGLGDLGRNDKSAKLIDLPVKNVPGVPAPLPNPSPNNSTDDIPFKLTSVHLFAGIGAVLFVFIATALGFIIRAQLFGPSQAHVGAEMINDYSGESSDLELDRRDGEEDSSISLSDSN